MCVCACVTIFCLCVGAWGGQTGIWFPCVDVLWLCEPPDVGVINWTWSSWRQLLSCLSSLLSLFFNLPESVHMDACGGHRATSGTSPCFPPPFESFTAEYDRLSGSWASGKFCLCLPSCYRNTGNICYHAWLYMGAGDPNSGPDDSWPCALSTEPSIHSYLCFQFIYFTRTRGNSLREWICSFHCVGPEDQTQIIRLGESWAIPLAL